MLPPHPLLRRMMAAAYICNYVILTLPQPVRKARQEVVFPLLYWRVCWGDLLKVLALRSDKTSTLTRTWACHLSQTSYFLSFFPCRKWASPETHWRHYSCLDQIFIGGIIWNFYISKKLSYEYLQLLLSTEIYYIVYYLPFC